MDSCSNEFCTKLNISFDLSDIQQDVSLLKLYKEFYRPQKYAIEMLRNNDLTSVGANIYDLREEDKIKIIKQLPKSLIQLAIPEQIGIGYMTAPKDSHEVIFPPHIDKVRKTAINFYLETNGDETTYYEYNDNKLNEKFSFVANKGETWILNVDKPHSVKLKYPFSRKFLTISFKNLMYEKVIDNVQR